MGRDESRKFIRLAREEEIGYIPWEEAKTFFDPAFPKSRITQAGIIAGSVPAYSSIH